MTYIRKRLVRIDMSNPPPGRIDRSRMGKRNPNDTEPRPVVAKEDIEATLRLAAEENWPMTEREIRRLMEPWLPREAVSASGS